MDAEGERFIEYVKTANEKATEFLEWCKTSKLCKVVTAAVPEGIFPAFMESPELHDVKVDPYGAPKGKKKARGTDDEIYTNNEEVRRRVARGNTILTFTFNKERLACVPIWALKKFTGGIGDEDDFEESENVDLVPKWHRFFTKDPNESTRVVVTQKANGAAGHLTVLKVAKGLGGYVWIGGSKNVHLAIRSENDLKLYKQNSRYSVAVDVVEAAWREFHKKEVKLEKFLDTVWSRHLTACFELLDPEDAHIEDLSYLTAPELHLYALVSFERGTSSGSYICESPEDTFKLVEGLGLLTVKNSASELKAPSTRKELGADPVLSQIVEEIRRDYGNEGRVLYFLDSNGNVIGMLKKKTVWYIAIRAIREKLKVYFAVDLTIQDDPTPAPAPSVPPNTKTSSNIWEPFSPQHYVRIEQANHSQNPSQPAGNPKSLTQTRANVLKRSSKRMGELASWLGWGAQTRDDWKKVAKAAGEWAAGKMGYLDPSGKIKVHAEPEKFLDTMKNRFPVMWKQFLGDMGVDDRVALTDASETFLPRVDPKVPRALFLEAEEGGLYGFEVVHDDE
ncbi:hypothetical protein HDU97_000595 [Phlyctochytrium planicorne]|nr:hypothetical protein HDU97_000595 [Phlyctochytrium planicorne]